MTKEKAETLVLGSGPGGYVAAIRAAQLGKKVVIVEGDEIGGVCLNVGCIPSKALITAGHRYRESITSDFLGLTVSKAEINFKKTQEWKDKQVVKKLTTGIKLLLKKNNIKIVKGYGKFTGPNELIVMQKDEETFIEFEQAIIATGSRPIEIPTIPFGSRVIDSSSALSLNEIPKKLVIIGGGVIGSEIGGAYTNLGTEVTILEGSPQLLPSYEKDLVKVVETGFKQKGMSVFTNVLAHQASEDSEGVTVSYQIDEKDEKINADYVMVTVGRKPNTDQIGLEKIGVELDKQGLIIVDKQYRTSLEHVFAIGDVVEGPALAHKASYDGKITAEVISGKKVMRDYKAIPTICFTDPEIASVGLTFQEAKAQEREVSVATFPLQANGRALTLNATEGFIRLVVDKKNQNLLGAQIVGVGASDLVAELTLAIESSLTLEDIALTIHAHPTLSESIMDVSELALGLPIHI